MGKGRPQQQEMNRSGHTPLDPDNAEARAQQQRIPPDKGGKRRSVPADNREGHRPKRDQDRPVELGGAGHGTGRKER